MNKGISYVAVSKRKCIITPGHGEVGEEKKEEKEKSVHYLMNA